MPTLRFNLSISRDDYLRYYQGHASRIAVTTDNNQRLQFPAEHLRPFINHDGVYGQFEIEFSDENRFIQLHRV